MRIRPLKELYDFKYGTRVSCATINRLIIWKLQCRSTVDDPFHELLILTKDSSCIYFNLDNAIFVNIYRMIKFFMHNNIKCELLFLHTQ